jgi:hypothetical protein
LTDYIAEQRGAVTSVYFDVCNNWEKWFYFGADIHYDSIYCNRDLFFQHMDEVKSKNAMAVFVGDLYDAMQGRYDKRRSMPELRPEYQQKENYYDLLVDCAYKDLSPYKDNILMMADGNHELSVLKNANTNILDRLVGKLRDSGSNTLHGGYGGWIRLMFNLSDGKSTGPRSSIRIKYFHGSGGEAPVTRGAIQTNRQALIYPDANVVINGHSHHNYYIPISRDRLSNQGQLYFDLQHHIRTPGYKQAYGDGTTGWEITRGGVPKPIGCVWCRMYCQNNQIKMQFIPDVQGADPVSVDSNDLYNGKIYDDDGYEE